MSEPYQVEYAKTGRAACKGCKEKIQQGALRLGVMVQSAFHDGKHPNWYHEDCFFKKQRVASASELGNFVVLQPDDKTRIKGKIENCGTSNEVPAEKGKGKKKRPAAGTASGPTDGNEGVFKDFSIEYAKSSQASCRHCERKICKDEVRIGKTVYDTANAKKYGGETLWHHVKCFAARRDTLGFHAGAESLPGFETLTDDDQEMWKNELPRISVEEIPQKRIKIEKKSKEELKNEKELQQKIKEQDKLFSKCRETLRGFLDSHKDRNRALNKLKDVLEVNIQKITKSENEMLNRLADCMAFGSVEPCPECRGQLVLDNYNYRCTGNVSEWTKCQYATTEPNRKPFLVPAHWILEDQLALKFKEFEGNIGVRVFEAPPPPTTTSTEVAKEEPAEEKVIPNAPLKNLQFLIYGRLKSPKAEVKKRVLELGGLVVTKLTDTTVAVISSKKEVEKMSEAIAGAQEKDIEVVEESFLDLIDPAKGSVADSLELVKVNNIAKWGSDPARRVPRDVVDGRSVATCGCACSADKSDKSTVAKLKVKGGSAVEADSGLADEAHVYADELGKKYNIVLAKADVVSQKNSFYKLQVLESDTVRKYWLFRSWGRIGTESGGHKLEPMRDNAHAIHTFHKLFHEKTGNRWYELDKFKKHPDKYYPVDMDYGEGEQTAERVLAVDATCALPTPVQHLVLKIFDIHYMKQTLLEFEIDTEKMPLGKLSKKQIKAGYEVLTELLGYIEKGKASKNKIMDATNRFYTMVPHDFGMNNPPLLDNVEAIKKKTEMLDNLLEIEIAYSLLNTDDETGKNISPIEANYLRLKCDLEPLDRATPEFAMIAEYTANTHAGTHSYYTLEIGQAFKVVRHGESERYKPFKNLHNRRLLWHGSRVTNFAGILSQGLRIAPPEAPVTGYMFGKGIYFADMVSKSANYCCTDPQSPVGVLLLCEVALGNMKKNYDSEMITKLPEGLHSTWGVGRTRPDPAQDRALPDGTVVPLGTPQPIDESRATLLYNEFIVYDVAQVNVRYLLQMKFNYKY